MAVASDGRLLDLAISENEDDVTVLATWLSNQLIETINATDLHGVNENVVVFEDPRVARVSELELSLELQYTQQTDAFNLTCVQIFNGKKSPPPFNLPAIDGGLIFDFSRLRATLMYQLLASFTFWQLAASSSIDTYAKWCVEKLKTMKRSACIVPTALRNVKLTVIPADPGKEKTEEELDHHQIVIGDTRALLPCNGREIDVEDKDQRKTLQKMRGMSFVVSLYQDFDYLDSVVDILSIALRSLFTKWINECTAFLNESQQSLENWIEKVHVSMTKFNNELANVIQVKHVVHAARVREYVQA